MNDDRIYKLIKLKITLMGMLPRKILNFFSDSLGLIWYKIDKRHRDLVFENIKYAYPGRFSKGQARRFVKKVFKTIAGIPFEIIWAYGKTYDELSDFFLVKGAENIKKAQAKGNGIILLSCHMGNFELQIEAFPQADIKPPNIVYRKLDFKPLERFMLERRQRFGAVMIPTGGATAKVYTVLENDGVMGTLFDQNAEWHNGVVTDFFGRPACSKYSLAKLVLKSKASVIPTFLIRENDKYILEFLPEVTWQTTGCPIKDLENNTQNYVSAIESIVRRAPEQYFWVHNRWKTKPYSMIKEKSAWVKNLCS